MNRQSSSARPAGRRTSGRSSAGSRSARPPRRTSTARNTGAGARRTTKNSGRTTTRNSSARGGGRTQRKTTRNPRGNARGGVKTKRPPARRSSRKPKPTKSYKTQGPKVNYHLPDSDKKLRIIPVGGCEEVGRNMTIFEYDGDIIILDMGVQFPEEDMPGVDLIIPNVRYLKGKEKNIRGVIFSHGHLDHIGAAPFLLDELGNPVIAGRDLTLAMIKHKLEDREKGSTKRLKAIRIKGLDDVIKMGKFTIKFFQVEHSIMDAVGVIVETPAGSAIHPGDWTMERDKEGKATIDYSDLANVKQPSVLMLESLGAIHDTHHGTYEEMYKNIKKIIENAPGRVIIGTFSSQIERIKWVVNAAKSMGKKVAFDGYSMKTNVEIAKKLGYIKIPRGAIIDIRKIENYKDTEVVVICTGAQGESNAVLSRIVNGQHRSLKLKEEDTVVFSSSVIPGNERTIQRLKDNMYRQCNNVIHRDIMDVHVSGHASKTDIVEVVNQIKPTYFMPVYANHFMLKEAAWLVRDKAGFDPRNIYIPDNGTIMEVDQQGARILDNKIPTDYVFVDGLGISDAQHVVLRDRQVLAEDGMVVVIATIDTKTGRLLQNPDIISRGFVFLKDNRDLIEDLRHKVKKMVIQSDPKTWADTNEIRNNLRDKIGQFLYSKTEKRPMILPVVIEV